MKKNVYSFLMIVLIIGSMSCKKKQDDNDPTVVLTNIILSNSPVDIASSFKNLQGYNLDVTYDNQYVYIQSTGIPLHSMMKGITGWNSQTPVPYSISMKIPANAVPAAIPTAHLVDGPIAIAVNGIPIFEPTKQGAAYDDAGDPFIQGELDSCGGHAGRGDDYHYHIAPICIMNALAPNQPIAWALDGFPIYGLKEIDGSALDRNTLDTLNGHTFQGNYHYHANTSRPYINKGFKGTLDISILPTVPAFRATGGIIQTVITDFYTDASGWTILKYQKNGGIAQLNYRLASGTTNCYDFQFIDENGVTTTETDCK